MTQNRFP